MRDIRTPAYRIDPRTPPVAQTALARQLLPDLARHVTRARPFFARAAQAPAPPAPVVTAADLAAPVYAALYGQPAVQVRASMNLPQTPDEIKQMGLAHQPASSIPRQDFSATPGTFKGPAPAPTIPLPTGPRGLDGPGFSVRDIEQLRALHSNLVYDPNNTSPKPPTAREISLAKRHAQAGNCPACHAFLVGAQRAARGQQQIERLRQEQQAQARLAAAQQSVATKRQQRTQGRTASSARPSVWMADTTRQAR
jgi:hypothetical protein